jgi:hypothetical protein
MIWISIELRKLLRDTEPTAKESIGYYKLKQKRP